MPAMSRGVGVYTYTVESALMLHTTNGSLGTTTEAKADGAGWKK